jgi:hypothetical protein
MYIGLHVKYPFFLSDINKNWDLLKNIKEPLNIKSHENPPRQFFYSGGRTDRHNEANSLFSQFLQTRLKNTKYFIRNRYLRADIQARTSALSSYYTIFFCKVTSVFYKQ